MPIVEFSLEQLAPDRWVGQVVSRFAQGKEFRTATLAEALDAIRAAVEPHRPPPLQVLVEVPLPVAAPMPRRRPVRLASGGIAAPISKGEAAEMRAAADEAILKSVSPEMRATISAKKAEARGRRPAA